MNLSDLLDLGIVARLDDDCGLLLDAPEGVLTDELIERIRQSKPGLIAEFGSECEVGELGELHLLCMNPAGRGGTLPTGTAPTVRAGRWMLHFAGRAQLEVFVSPAATMAEMLGLHPDATDAEPLPEHDATRTPTEPERAELMTPPAAKPPSVAVSCTTCRFLKRPGLSPGYCSERDDLPPAYGTGHPLRKLPGDQGAGCTSYQTIED